MYTVYKHTSPSGKLYIGITSKQPEKRWSAGNGYRKCPRFYKAIRKYGWQNIQHEILAEGLTKEEAEAMEIELIKEHRTTDARFGYNIENGGNTIGTHSEETLRKISAGNKGKIVSEEAKQKHRESIKGKLDGEKNPFFGRHHTEETKEKQSEFMKGNAFFKGHHHSEEFREWKSRQMHDKYKEGGNPRCRAVEAVTPEGTKVNEYYSLREAARNEGITPSTLCEYIKKQRPIRGKIWRYV